MHTLATYFQGRSENDFTIVEKINILLSKMDNIMVVMSWLNCKNNTFCSFIGFAPIGKEITHWCRI
jgi:hypothetical protein